jgi:VacB/RNase II family 3'-5' exoribonuclease
VFAVFDVTIGQHYTHMSHRTILRNIAHRAMVRHGLLPAFSASALDEAQQAAPAPPDDAPVRDTRGLLWTSIDNDDSRDLDQLSVAEALGGGRTKVLVAIADVDALVPAGSASDDHARTNTTSVYTPAEIFPMLPERFSTDLTSLGQGDERLAMVVEMTVDAEGAVGATDIYRARVLNRARLTYDAVGAWLIDEGPLPAHAASIAGLADVLRLQDQVAQAMRRRRHARGALTLDTSQSHPVFAGDAIADLQPDARNRAKELIEDLMIAANAATAETLERKGFAWIRRVLGVPRRWDRIVALAATFGARLPDAPDAAALDAFLQSRRAADPLRFADVSLSVVKMLGSGEYVVEPPGTVPSGHFGLAVSGYTHSTAPNRRFPDLITQRLLKAVVAGAPPPYDRERLSTLARHCTTQEDQAAKVERQVRKSAAALFLQSRIGERFQAIVTGASEKGTWVRTLGTPVEGRVVKGFAGLDVGDKVDVKLVSTDVDQGFIDFTAL